MGTFLGWAYVTELGYSTNAELTRALLWEALRNVERGKPCGETLDSAAPPLKLPNGDADVPANLGRVDVQNPIQAELVRALRGAIERGVQLGRPELRLWRPDDGGRNQVVAWIETDDPLGAFTEEERHCVAAVLVYLEAAFPEARVSLAFRYGALQAFAVETEGDVLALAVAPDVWDLSPAQVTANLDSWDVAGDMRRAAPRVVVVRSERVEIRDQRQIPPF